MRFDARFLELARSPRGAGALAARPTASTRRSNPLCGDEIELDLLLEADMVRDIAHRARGCAILRVSASLLSDRVRGLSPDGARALATEFGRALSGTAPLPAGFETLAEVRLLPARRRCALLPWEALLEALG